MRIISNNGCPTFTIDPSVKLKSRMYPSTADDLDRAARRGLRRERSIDRDRLACYVHDEDAWGSAGRAVSSSLVSWWHEVANRRSTAPGRHERS